MIGTYLSQPPTTKCTLGKAARMDHPPHTTSQLNAVSGSQLHAQPSSQLYIILCKSLLKQNHVTTYSSARGVDKLHLPQPHMDTQVIVSTVV